MRGKASLGKGLHLGGAFLGFAMAGYLGGIALDKRLGTGTTWTNRLSGVGIACGMAHLIVQGVVLSRRGGHDRDDPPE